MRSAAPVVLTPDSLKDIGIRIGPGECSLTLFVEGLEAVPGVDPTYQHPSNEGFLAAFGTGFTPGVEVGFRVDGQPLHPDTVMVDDAGQFYAGGSALPLAALYEQGFLTQDVDPPLTLSVVGDTCATAQMYSEIVDLGEVVLDDDSPPVTGVGPAQPPPPDPGGGQGITPGEVFLLAVIGVGGGLGGFGGGAWLAHRAGKGAV